MRNNLRATKASKNDASFSRRKNKRNEMSPQRPQGRRSGKCTRITSGYDSSNSSLSEPKDAFVQNNARHRRPGYEDDMDSNPDDHPDQLSLHHDVHNPSNTREYNDKVRASTIEEVDKEVDNENHISTLTGGGGEENYNQNTALSIGQQRDDNTGKDQMLNHQYIGRHFCVSALLTTTIVHAATGFPVCGTPARYHA